MNDDRPVSLARQIEAVQWAALHVDAKRGRVAEYGMREAEKTRLIEALEAAAETLNLLQRGRR